MKLGNGRYIMPLRWWWLGKLLVPYKGKRFDFGIQLLPLGKLGIDWFTDAQRVYRFGPLILFDYKGTGLKS